MNSTKPGKHRRLAVRPPEKWSVQAEPPEDLAGGVGQSEPG
jgi:hypothetical protein